MPVKKIFPLRERGSGIRGIAKELVSQDSRLMLPV